jgi:hypothetical protein
VGLDPDPLTAIENETKTDEKEGISEETVDLIWTT